MMNWILNRDKVLPIPVLLQLFPLSEKVLLTKEHIIIGDQHLNATMIHFPNMESHGPAKLRTKRSRKYQEYMSRIQEANLSH